MTAPPAKYVPVSDAPRTSRGGARTVRPHARRFVRPELIGVARWAGGDRRYESLAFAGTTHVTGASGDTVKGTLYLGANPVDCNDVPTAMNAIVAAAPVTWVVSPRQTCHGCSQLVRPFSYGRNTPCGV